MPPCEKSLKGNASFPPRLSCGPPEVESKFWEMLSQATGAYYVGTWAPVPFTASHCVIFFQRSGHDQPTLGDSELEAGGGGARLQAVLVQPVPPERLSEVWKGNRGSQMPQVRLKC